MGEKYLDVIINDVKKYRLFKGDIDERELLWHQDERDREIFVLGGKDWKVQLDDELPIDLIEGKQIEIKNHKFHRVLKGNGNLIIRIIENK